MRRLMCVLLAAAVMSALSAAPDARARQAGSTQPRSSITGKDLGKALANPGVDIYFWSPGAWTLLGHVDGTHEVFYTPGASPSSVVQNTKGCGATYASLQKWCPFPVTAKVVKCNGAPEASPLSLEDDAPPLEDPQGRQLATPTPQTVAPHEVLVLVPTGNRGEFLKAITSEDGSGQNAPVCRAPKSDDAGSGHWGDSFVFDGSSGSVKLSVANPVAATPTDGGGVNVPLVGGIAAAGGLGAYFALRGGSSTTGGGTTPGTTTPSLMTVVFRALTVAGTISSSSSTTCGGPTASGTFTVSGTQTNAIVAISQFASLSGVTVPGSVTSPTSSSFVLTAAGTTTTITLTYQVASDNNTVTVTGPISIGGSCPVAYNLTAHFTIQ